MTLEFELDGDIYFAEHDNSKIYSVVDADQIDICSYKIWAQASLLVAEEKQEHRERQQERDR